MTAVQAVGLCLQERDAVVAVVRPGPPRLAAVASLALPPGWWQSPTADPAAAEADPAATGADRAAARAGRRSRKAVRRVLVRVRRRLGLPRWCPLAVVVGPGLAGIGGAPAAARSAELLARAGLVQGWVVPADRAAAHWSTVEVLVDPDLAAAAAAAGQPAELAVGAALAALPPGDLTALPSEELAAVPDGIDLEEWQAGPGWAVQRIGDTGDFDGVDDVDDLIDLDATPANHPSGGRGTGRTRHGEP